VLALLARRAAASVPLILGVLLLSFAFVESAPGSPADVLLGDRPVPPEIRARIEAAYGLDRPPVERLLHWIGSIALHGDLGWSISRSRPVSRVLADALPNSLLLAGTALLIHLAFGIALGVVSARFHRGWVDRFLGATSLTLYSMPTFWLGLMAILGLSYAVPLFPPSSLHTAGSEGWPLVSRLADLAWHLALPAAVLGLASAASMGRFVRAGMLESLGQDFVRAARARGVGRSRLLFVHALRNSLLPVITLLGLSMPILVSGSLVTEVVFGWPGMGRLTYDAILAQDLPVVLATTLVASIFVILGNVLADLASAAADPRIRLRPTRQLP
jgi:peptide/nickel transport system permease protein